MASATQALPAAQSGTITLGGDLTVNRMGFGAMRITGKGIWGPPADVDGALATLRRAVELGVNFIDTADSYGPFVSEDLIAKAPQALSCRSRHRFQGRLDAPRSRRLAAQRQPSAH